jgi:hypothetical protein
VNRIVLLWIIAQHCPDVAIRRLPEALGLYEEYAESLAELCLDWLNSKTNA